MAAEYRGALVKLTGLRFEDQAAFLEVYDQETQLLDSGWIPYPLMPNDPEAWWRESSSNRPDYTFAIRRLETDGFCGICNVHVDWRIGTSTIGIVLGTAHQNQGLGKDGLRTLIRFIFAHIGSRKVKLRVFAFNSRAIHVYQGLGFQLEARYRQEIFRWGQWHDVLDMGLFAQEFIDPQGSIDDGIMTSTDTLTDPIGAT